MPGFEGELFDEIGRGGRPSRVFESVIGQLNHGEVRRQVYESPAAQTNRLMLEPRQPVPTIGTNLSRGRTIGTGIKRCALERDDEVGFDDGTVEATGDGQLVSILVYGVWRGVEKATG